MFFINILKVTVDKGNKSLQDFIPFMRIDFISSVEKFSAIDA